MSHAAVKELAHRNQNGLEVTLLWDPRSDEVSVEVVDHLDDSGFRLPIAGHLALDAFHHPYAYAQSHENQLRPPPADDFGGVTGMATLAPATELRPRNWARVVALQPLVAPVASVLVALTCLGLDHGS